MAGEVVEKEAMARTFEEAARRLHVPLENLDKSARITGHSLRVTGAQGLARMGIDTWAIQLLGRWGSSQVLGYIRDVPLENAAEWANRAAKAAQSFATPSSSSRSPAVAAPHGAGNTGKLEALKLLLEDQPTAIAATKEDEYEAVLVSNYGMYHRLPLGRDLSKLQEHTAACGWVLTACNAKVLHDLPENALYKKLCSRCFTQRRNALKASLELKVARV